MVRISLHEAFKVDEAMEKWVFVDFDGWAHGPFSSEDSAMEFGLQEKYEGDQEKMDEANLSEWLVTQLLTPPASSMMGQKKP